MRRFFAHRGVMVALMLLFTLSYTSGAWATAALPYTANTTWTAANVMELMWSVATDPLIALIAISIVISAIVGIVSIFRRVFGGRRAAS